MLILRIVSSDSLGEYPYSYNLRHSPGNGSIYLTCAVGFSWPVIPSFKISTINLLVTSITKLI